MKIIGIAIFITLASIIINRQVKIHQYEKHLSSIKNKYDILKQENDSFLRIIGDFYSFEGSLEKDYIGKDDNGNDIKLSANITSQKPTLVFKYKASDCSRCIDNVFEQLKESSINKNIILISNFENFTSMKFIKKKYNLHKALFIRINDSESNFISPCLYIINKNLIITHLLYISTNDIILPSYLKQIQTYIYSDSIHLYS